MSAAFLRGKTIAFSGAFNKFSRDQVLKAATAAGATVNSSVSKNIDMLVTGNSNVGVKKVKAKHMGIKVLPAKSFTDFLKAGGAARMQKAAAPVKKATFEEDFEAEEESSEGAMPWEMEADAAPAPKARRAATAPMKADAARRPGYPRRVISYPVRPFSTPKVTTVTYAGASKTSRADPMARREAPTKAVQVSADVRPTIAHPRKVIAYPVRAFTAPKMITYGGEPKATRAAVSRPAAPTKAVRPSATVRPTIAQTRKVIAYPVRAFTQPKMITYDAACRK